MARWGPAREPEWASESWQPPPAPQPPEVEKASVSSVQEISLWTVVAAVQAVERKVESQALKLLSLEGRAESAEKKVMGLEKAVRDFGEPFGKEMVGVGSLVQENTRRLEHVERQLQQRSCCWAPRPEPRARGG